MNMPTNELKMLLESQIKDWSELTQPQRNAFRSLAKYLEFGLDNEYSERSEYLTDLAKLADELGLDLVDAFFNQDLETVLEHISDKICEAA